MGPLENGYQELLQPGLLSSSLRHAAERKATLLFITSSPTSLDHRHTGGGDLDTTSASVKYPRGVPALQQSRKSNDGGAINAIILPATLFRAEHGESPRTQVSGERGVNPSNLLVGGVRDGVRRSRRA